MNVRRAAEHHEVMRMIKPRPKPTKADRPKKRKASKPRRKILEKRIEEIVKFIIAWRDGQVCVFSEMDGGRCGNGLMWNHYIRQQSSSWLRYNLGNVFWGCGSHNMLEHHGDKTFDIWYTQKFGISVVVAMDEEKKAHKGKKHEIHELETMLSEYDELYQNRYHIELDFESLIDAGYYGKIVKANYRKD